MDDLRQISHGQLKARKYSRYDINGYRFRTSKLEKIRPQAATTNSGVVATATNADGGTHDYYGVLQDITEYTLGGAKEFMFVLFDCEWFDPQQTREDEFGIVEVKHESRFKGSDYSNVVLAHQAQQVYYLTYPHENLKSCWVVYKINPDVHLLWYYYYNTNNEDDDSVNIYQEEGEQSKNREFTISEDLGLNEVASLAIDLMAEEPGPSRARTRKSQRILEKQQRLEIIEQRVAEADSDADDFWKVYIFKFLYMHSYFNTKSIYN